MDKAKWFKDKEKGMENKLEDCQKNRAIVQMARDICEELHSKEECTTIDTCDVKRFAEIAVAKGYRKERYGQWILDESYQGKDKMVYKCTNCGHWQSAKRRSDKIFYMHHCPFCGAKMIKKEEKKN